MKQLDISLDINGARYDATVEARMPLSDFIREQCGLTGTHLGCEHGVCGACTVMVDGQPVRSCLTLAASVDRPVTTIEGLRDPIAEAVKAAFHEFHALQCGFCTPGFLATAVDIIRRGLAGDEESVRREIAGNLCRCTGYQGIVKAILSAAERIEG